MPVKSAPKQIVAVRSPPVAPPPRSGQDRSGLDGHWERKLRAGSLSPDFTLDLHEHSLDAAYNRVLGGIDIARETGARVILIIAGRERPTHAADRAEKRGAIRAKLLDWLAASRHASAIAAIRKAHRRHGGEGALYVILKRDR
ncbi:Smr/MutS family protein [Qipengyuania sp.]|uniref:Smr/MutS family protein n=1 Tax=Qipengyuania sp. TaxID=2004515 RepID=UPI0035C87A0A